MTENITVQEMGEDSDLWIVTGTTDAHSAEEAVRQWCEKTMEQTIEAFLDADDLVEFTITFRKDWYWLPGGDPENPLDEAALVYPKFDLMLPDMAAVIGPFSGFLVKA
ncbi:hypothetical protein ACLQ8T_06090 [Glutamicibacter sp. FR1]|uniref:hypothetical protein n=1 Tax=Glutamicibacter sp. FR1 TaxID=3393744 RepID=UPI0039B10DDF